MVFSSWLSVLWITLNLCIGVGQYGYQMFESQVLRVLVELEIGQNLTKRLLSKDSDACKNSLMCIFSILFKGLK
jgi:hypothetical protein